jgi:cephalosporin hydroxylase
VEFNPLDYPQMLSPPNFVTEQWSWHGHIPFAFTLVAALEPGIIVELGVQSGNSFAAFCQGVSMAGCATSCFGVDAWEPRFASSKSMMLGLQRFLDKGYGEFSSLIHAEFSQAANLFRPKSIDLLHIDGNHSTESAQRDFDTYEPLLSDRSVVLFHDTVSKDLTFGVRHVFDTVAPGKKRFNFEHSFGLGVLCYGAEVPEAVLSIFDEGRAGQTREFFAKLGSLMTRCK